MRGGASYEMTSSCVQGGIRPLGGYQPNMLMEPTSPASAWSYHHIVPKQEPIDPESRNDSGVASGSDFISTSPESDQSDNFCLPYSTPKTSQDTIMSHSPAYTSTPIANQGGYQQPNIQRQMLYSSEHNPLSPPSSEPMASPKPKENAARNAESDDPLRRMQMTLEKNGFLPPQLSPKFSECSAEDDNKSVNSMEEFNDHGLRTPKVNSHGKVKKFKCKQCDFVAITKLDFWEHSKGHIRAGKLLSCPKCPFGTQLKHHLEYHILNHLGAKPHKCPQCSYTCVNKSMLNSHLKSHSNVYQYRCSECSYATKYCHSLKQHARKFKHKPAMVLNPDGTPNPLPIIDIYGTRRGPKMKNQKSKTAEESTSKPAEQVLPFPLLNQFMLNATSQMQLPFPGFSFFAEFHGALPNPLLLQNLEKLARERQGSFPAQNVSGESYIETENGVLDLSKPEEPHKNRRKGRAYKLTQNSSNSSDDGEEAITTMFGNVEVVEDKQPEENCVEMTEVANNNNNKEDFGCQYCNITFGEPVLYTMHMGYHGYNNPFTCNMCGEECKDKVAFFVHIARTPHT
ncbi:hypothetical protein JTB14_009598 [Gonioctena quinquepunctata]|nr:hypothetical protein JTB14_009598 [Gonioctena quinquepunctata]